MTPRTLTAGMALSCVVLVQALLTAQLPIPEGRPIDPALRFEAASIKTYSDNGPTRVRMQPSGAIDVTGGSVRMLVQNAFRVRAEHVAGLPDWADRERYSVVAKAPAGASVTAIPTMLANLLADRFNLVTHRETRETQSFDLVLALDNGRLGPALRPTSAECQVMVAA